LSDALNDIEKDITRVKLMNKFLEKITQYLSSPTDNAKTEVLESAKEVDDVPYGYFGGGTEMASFVEKNIDRLKNKSPKAWGKLLRIAIGTQYYRQLKELSPFKGKIMLVVDYGCGFVNFGGEIENVISQLLTHKGYKTYDCDKYAVFVAEETFKNADVQWIDCGILGVKGPRIYNKEKRKFIEQSEE
jgi:hypothetical protein